MKEYVYVQFIALDDDISILMDKLKALGDDFLPLATYTETKSEYDFTGDPASVTIGGKISAVYATVIKLRDPFLAERMQISYISEELKNKYRKGLR